MLLRHGRKNEEDKIKKTVANVYDCWRSRFFGRLWNNGLLTELMGWNYLTSSGFSFAVSVLVNYALGLHNLLFDINENNSRRRNFTVFVGLSCVGQPHHAIAPHQSTLGAARILLDEYEIEGSGSEPTAVWGSG